tara:strand:+ start:1009 stop:1290 length:282 start_codon:yes stop_codon:yes gene_type:complete
MERKKIRKEVMKIIQKHLVDKGYLEELAMIQFVYIDMSTELGQSIIGLCNYAKNNPETISDSSISACLGHDIGGVLRGDKHFIPKALSYTKFY